MSKIIKISAENVKRLRAVEITPKGNIVAIGGKNAQGKTSLLDSIGMALSGKEICEQPVRTGEEKARIIIETEDIVVKRTFTATGGTSLVVENKEGMRYSSPQAVLDKLTGKLTFDPLSFMRLEAKDQANALKRLVNLDFTALDAKRKQLYDERTIRNKDYNAAKLSLDLLVAPDMTVSLVDTAELVAELEKAKQHNAQKVGLQLKYEQAEDVMKDALSGEESLKIEIAKVEKKLTELRAALIDQTDGVSKAKARCADTLKALNDFTPIDEDPIKARLAGAAEANKRVEEKRAYENAEKAVANKKAECDALTSKIEEIDSEKSKQLAAVKFPIEGLSFSDSGVLYQGVPLEQASGAEKLRVSVAMAAAMNPKLRVMLVRDGSLLDDENLQLLGALAKEYDVQVWVEMVGKGENVQVVIEDGSVAEVRDLEPEAVGVLPDKTVPFNFEN